METLIYSYTFIDSMGVHMAQNLVSTIEGFDPAYKQYGVIDIEPSPHIVKLVPKYKEGGLERVLDHGCGTGRHVVYLAEQGFYVVGTDISQVAIQYAREWVECFGLRGKVELIREEMDCVPDLDESFGAVISNRVISHAPIEKGKRTTAELKRVLKPGGLLYLATISNLDQAYGKGEKFGNEESTFINIPGFTGEYLPHHFYTREELENLFSDFHILYLNLFESPPSKYLSHGLKEWVMLAQKS